MFLIGHPFFMPALLYKFSYICIEASQGYGVFGKQLPLTKGMTKHTEVILWGFFI